MGCCYTKSSKSILQEAAEYLQKYFYKDTEPWNGKTVDDVIHEYPDMSVAELIRIFFQDKHTFHDPRTTEEAESSFTKPWTEVYENKESITIRLGPFTGKFEGSLYEEQYISMVQKVIQRHVHKKQLIVDLRYNGGGNQNIMFKALKGIELWEPGIVLVGENTASAGEMIAAYLIHDLGFKREGPRTAGMLSYMKNIILSDGSFLGITTSHYTTPNGYICHDFFV